MNELVSWLIPLLHLGYELLTLQRRPSCLPTLFSRLRTTRKECRLAVLSAAALARLARTRRCSSSSSGLSNAVLASFGTACGTSTAASATAALCASASY